MYQDWLYRGQARQQELLAEAALRRQLPARPGPLARLLTRLGLRPPHTPPVPSAG